MTAVDDGRYGVCEQCGAEIGAERLDARDHAAVGDIAVVDANVRAVAEADGVGDVAGLQAGPVIAGRAEVEDPAFPGDGLPGDPRIAAKALVGRVGNHGAGRAGDALVIAEQADGEVQIVLRGESGREADAALGAGIAEGVGEHSALEEDVVIVAVVAFEAERRLVLAGGDQQVLDPGKLEVGVGEAHLVAGEIHLDPVVEHLHRSAVEPDPGSAEGGSVIIVVAARPLVEDSVIGLDHASRLEGEVALVVGKGGRETELDLPGLAFFCGLDPGLGGGRLLLELGVAGLELLHARLQRIEAVDDRVAGRRRGRLLGVSRAADERDQGRAGQEQETHLILH